jgi:hypothetical protein
MQTVAERSGYRATSTHAEMMAFVEALSSPRLRRTSIGVSGQGRELPLLILSSSGLSTPESARRLCRPVVLLQNCIHAGEVEGKEAALALVRDLLADDDGLLERVTVLVLPMFNPDGNDAMDTANRALDLAKLTGQDGPPRVGTRVNGKGINLNRDYIRHDAPEMRALQTRLCHRWRPDLTVDTHATNGSVHRFAMTFDIPHTVESGAREPVDFMRQLIAPEVVREVRARHGLESGWYGNFCEDERVLDAGGTTDGTGAVGEGWVTYPHHPRFGSNYRGLTGRMDLLLECYSYLPYAERIRTTYAWLAETLRAVARRPDEVLGAVRDLPPEHVAIRYGLGPFPEPVEILTTSPRTPSGAPVAVRMPHLARFYAVESVRRPSAYAVPASLRPFLVGHGLRVEAGPATAEVEVPTFEGARREGGRAILEAAGTGVRQVSWRREVRPLDDRVLVPTDQPLGAVAVYLCEPGSDDGLVENGLVETPVEGGEFAVWRVA